MNWFGTVVSTFFPPPVHCLWLQQGPPLATAGPWADSGYVQLCGNASTNTRPTDCYINAGCAGI